MGFQDVASFPPHFLKVRSEVAALAPQDGLRSVNSGLE